MPLGHEAGRPHLTARCLVSRVAVFGDNETAANPAPAAETAAAAAELRKHRGQTTTGQTWRMYQ